MATIHKIAPARNPFTVASRTSFQTARPGWRPRKGTPAQRAQYVAESILLREDAGAGWTWATYGLEDQPAQQQLVSAALDRLRAAQTEAAQQTDAAWGVAYDELEALDLSDEAALREAWAQLEATEV